MNIEAYLMSVLIDKEVTSHGEFVLLSSSSLTVVLLMITFCMARVIKNSSPYDFLFLFTHLI